MTDTSKVAFNSHDPVQVQFLSSLALGESGTLGHNSTFVGFGGTDLSTAPHDPFGFPTPLNTGSSSAAGTYQFVRETWDTIANKYHLDFSHPADQNAGAWYYAQETFAQNTGGKSLTDALKSGDFTTVQGALSSVWPSVNGNGAAPQGLANSLAAGIGAEVPGLNDTGAPAADGSGDTGGIFGAIENWFERFGLIIAGVIIVAIAGWFLLKKGL